MLIVIMGPLGRAPFNSISKMAEDKKKRRREKRQQAESLQREDSPFFLFRKKKVQSACVGHCEAALGVWAHQRTIFSFVLGLSLPSEGKHLVERAPLSRVDGLSVGALRWQRGFACVSRRSRELFAGHLNRGTPAPVGWPALMWFSRVIGLKVSHGIYVSSHFVKPIICMASEWGLSIETLAGDSVV